MPAGRPSVITKEVLRKLEHAFAVGASDREACFYADVSTTAFYEYQERHPEFAERKNALKERPVLVARQSVVKSMESDGTLALKYLERKAKAEFGLRNEVDVTSNGETVGQPLDANMLTQFLMQVQDGTKR